MRTKCIPLSQWLAEEQYHVFVELLNEVTNSRCLYVGLRHDSADYWYDILIDNNNQVDVLEIAQSNVDYLRTLDNWNIIHGDVTEFDFSSYDALFWVQGPEHVTKEKLNDLLPKIAKLDNYFLSVPNADYPGHNIEQAPMFGNQYEEHVSRLNRSFFQQFFPNDQIIEVDDVLIVKKVNNA